LRHRLTRTRVVVLVIGAAAIVAGTAGSLGSAHAASGRQAIPNTRPGWLGHAKNLGHAPAGAAVDARVYLTPNGGMAKLRQFALAVSTPGNAQYRHFLTPSQYFQRFGTTGSTVSAVKSWLTGAGLHISGTEAHNRWLEVRGNVAQAQAAFGVSINSYRHDGMTVQAPTSALSVPSGVASSVLTVLGVDTTPMTVSPSTQKPPPPEPGFHNAPPCSAYYGEKLATSLPQFEGHTLPYAPCGYTGPQFRSAYEGSTTLDGTGVTVAITDAYGSPNIVSDAATYASRNGDRAYAPGQLSQFVAKPLTRVNNGQRQCGASGWYGEETLDVEAVHAMAQGARIRYYGAASCYDADFLDTFARVNDDDAAQIVTNSWGSTELGTRATTIAAYQQAFLQGAAEGITYMFSSGDDGDESVSTGVVQADYPTSDPYATRPPQSTQPARSPGRRAGAP
jgi:subtilase family serine protease